MKVYSDKIHTYKVCLYTANSTVKALSNKNTHSLYSILLWGIMASKEFFEEALEELELRKEMDA